MNAKKEAFENLYSLESDLGVEWKAIRRAIAATDLAVAELNRLIVPSDGRAIAEDASLVVFGSVARGEITSNSDLDWIVLVDGQVDDQHFRASHDVKRILKDAGKIEPGNSGLFGGLGFSHDIVHQIGGNDDSNRNLTLRMLLLLESRPIGDNLARERVVKAILKRYLADDPSWTWKSDGKIPRFLLNDVVRFWRTMAVDFADKFHDQFGEKWALRNTKLRFSRKLLFVAGMLACFSWHLENSSRPTAANGGIDIALSYFSGYLARPPLEILASELRRTRADRDICAKLFKSYDDFLSILDNEEKREELKNLPRDSADKSAVFQQVRAISHTFRDALLGWMFSSQAPLLPLVRDYGLF
jgi:predicted nucleotidyltransferase